MVKLRALKESSAILVLVAQLAFLPLAHAADLDMGARQAVGLFQMACVGNAGDDKAERDWMDSHHVPHLNAQGAAIFLGKNSGTGYDASNPTGRYAVTVLDNGLCTVFAEHAKDSDVISALEASLVGLARQNDHPDASDPRLHHYDYILSRGGIDYTMVVSTDAVPGHMQAILSIGRRASGTSPATPAQN